MQRDELVTYLDHFLDIPNIVDYGPQGLQVEADNETIQRIALAVDVAPPIIAAAAEWGADMLLVHHGILWRDVQPLAGPLGARVRALLSNGINLYAAHLPLDAHPDVGNNAVLAALFGVTVESWWCAPKGTPLAVVGAAPPGLTRDGLVTAVAEALNTTPRLLAHGPVNVERVAILSGFGADEVANAAALGADTFLTGETSHSSYWAAEDHGLNVIYAGHYATETVGVQALGRHLAERFGLEARFLDFPTRL